MEILEVLDMKKIPGVLDMKINAKCFGQAIAQNFDSSMKINATILAKKINPWNCFN